MLTPAASIVSHPSGDGRQGLFLPADAPPVYEAKHLIQEGVVVTRSWFERGLPHEWPYPILTRWLGEREFDCTRPFEIVRMDDHRGWGVFYLPPATPPNEFFNACIQVSEIEPETIHSKDIQA